MHPLLFKCDREGRVVWMSEQARAVVGDAPLMRAIVDYLRAGGTFRVWPAYVMSEMLLFGAQAESAAEAKQVGLDEKLLNHYFQLEKAERRLALRRARAGGRSAALRRLERERRRIGRELHTGVGQMLAAIRMQLEVIAARMPSPPEEVQKALDRIARLSEEALEEVRSVSRRLYPPDWQSLTLEEALRRLWDLHGVPDRFEARLRLENLPREPGQETRTFLYRAAQEGLTNVARHSGANRVEMALAPSGDRLLLTLYDNGRGFDAAAASGKGLGLRSIRDAAQEIGAEFLIESAPGSTTLRITAPFRPGEPGAQS
jgi:signal transduction histidine kinase